VLVLLIGKQLRSNGWIDWAILGLAAEKIDWGGKKKLTGMRIDVALMPGLGAQGGCQ